MAQPLVQRRTWAGPRRAGGWARAADTIRVLALASVVVGTWHGGATGAALFLLVLGGCVVPLAVRLPSWLDAVYCGTLLVAAWAAQLDWYVAIGWLDLAVHAAATGLVAAVGTIVLVRRGAVAAPADPALRHARTGAAVVAVGVGVVGAVLWELGEWAGHELLDDRIQVGYADTLGDLAAALVGSLVAALLVGRSRTLSAEPA